MSSKNTYRQNSLRVMISGGGTGGHIYPAIAIANAIKAMRPDTEFVFVGAKGKMEMQKVPEAGYHIIGLWISGIQRSLSVKNLMFPFKVVSSIVKSFRILKKFKPDVVIGVGGYASGPLLYAATKRKYATLIQEQNSYAGLTNKWLAKGVDKICVAYEGMDKFFPKNKLILTGNPVRNDMGNVDSKREEALAHFGFEDGKKTLLVIGGSLGAKTINKALTAHVGQLLAEDIQVLWQCGEYYLERVKTQTAHLAFDNLKIMPFIHRMDYAYAVADLVISRAGALSISELCIVGKPVIFVPSPNVAEDHQTKNAKAIEEELAAVLVPDADAKEELVPMAQGLMDAPDQRKMFADNIKNLAKPNAADDIATEVLNLIK